MEIPFTKKILFAFTFFYLVLFFLGSYAFAFAYPFSHLSDTDLFSFSYIFFQVARFSFFLLLPLAVFYSYRTPKNIVKILFPVLSLCLLFFFGTYTSLDKLDSSLPYYNSNGLNASEIEIYNKMNLFLPSWVIKTEYLLEMFLVFFISVFLLFRERIQKKDFNSLLYYPIFFVLSLPLNLSENFTRTFSDRTNKILHFSNFSIWHFLLFFLVILFTLLFYFALRIRSRETKLYVLRILCMTMMLQFFGKNSMLVGDGYNIYNNVFASIPLFICDIGKYIVFLAVMLDRKWFYQCAFFVHGAGALTVFFYFGKEGTKNFGTIFSYSFLYFTITHILLFLLSVLPVYLGLVRFRIKSVLSSSLYYFVVILIAAFTSIAVTNFSMTITDSLGNTLSSPFYPNYAFTQICPLPMEFYTFLNVRIGNCEINFVYEFMLFISYLVLFFTFLGFNEGMFYLLQKIKDRKCSKMNLSSKEANHEETL